jgi:hypothetical protein
MASPTRARSCSGVGFASSDCLRRDQVLLLLVEIFRQRAQVGLSPAQAESIEGPIHSTCAGAGDLWAIVLAGGEGRRLLPPTRRLYGEERPKQYAALGGSTSLLRQTLERVALVARPADRSRDGQLAS